MVESTQVWNSGAQTKADKHDRVRGKLDAEVRPQLQVEEVQASAAADT